MGDKFFRRRILGIKSRGVRLDPQTNQNIQVMPHSGDIAYDLKGSDVIAKRSEYRELTRELILNPVLGENLNEVGQNKHIIKRTQRSRVVDLKN